DGAHPRRTTFASASVVVGSEQRVGSAVDEEYAAAAEARVGTEQEGDAGGDLLGAAEATGRNREAADRVAEERGREAGRDEGRYDRARADRVQADRRARPPWGGGGVPHPARERELRAGVDLRREECGREPAGRGLVVREAGRRERR